MKSLAGVFTYQDTTNNYIEEILNERENETINIKTQNRIS